MPTWGPTTVPSDADDGYEYNTYWDVDYGWMWFGNNGTIFRPAMRWTNITVPAGATITSASIVCDVESSTGTTDGDWKADVGANRTSALSGTHRPNSGWTQSTATGTQPAITGTGTLTIDVTSVVQELVNLGGWTSGNAACFAGYPTTGATNIVGLDDVFDAGGTEATLEIVYTAGGGSLIFSTPPIRPLIVR